MDYIPIVVIGRVAVFSDSNSLVLLSCCSKWLRYCVSQHNNLWHQRYTQYYNIADGNEVKWLAWYVKTVCASRLLASQTKKAINTTQSNSQYIEWFRAFCYRRAADANWLKDTPYPVKNLVEKEPGNIQSIVLQRIVYHHGDLQKCFIAEQCQPIGEASIKRFWHVRRLFWNNISYNPHAIQCLISDRFVVTISEQAIDVDLFHKKPCIISIWPVNRVSIMRPRQFSCLCDDASIRGRWMMINQLEITEGETNRSNIIATTRVFDLANGQMCMGTITANEGETFLLRVTEEAATIFSRTLQHSDTTTMLKWNVWEFSTRYLGCGPHCLMQGEIRFNTFKGFRIIVKKLDDNRVLVEYSSPLNIEILKEHMEDEIRLAMISTECSHSNDCIKDAKPIWTRNDGLYGTVPLFGSNRILVISERGWTVHSLIDGVILAHIDVETLDLALENPRLLYISFYVKIFITCIGGFVLYRSKTDDTFIAVDLTNSSRTKNLGITNSEYLYKTCERRSILVKFSYLIRQPLLLNDTFSTRNAALMIDGEGYRIIDLSF